MENKYISIFIYLYLPLFEVRNYRKRKQEKIIKRLYVSSDAFLNSSWVLSFRRVPICYWVLLSWYKKSGHLSIYFYVYVLIIYVNLYRKAIVIFYFHQSSYLYSSTIIELYPFSIRMTQTSSRSPFSFESFFFCMSLPTRLSGSQSCMKSFPNFRNIYAGT